MHSCASLMNNSSMMHLPSTRTASMKNDNVLVVEGMISGLQALLQRKIERQHKLPGAYSTAPSAAW